MPISTLIQFYVDNELLSNEQALDLAAEQIQILEKQFVKRIITSHTIDIRYFLVDMDPEGKQQINQVASCMEDYLNNGLISQEELDSLDLGQCIKLGQLFIHDLLLSRAITINQALELDATYAMSLDGLNELITAGKLTQEQIFLPIRLSHNLI